ncbi:DUF58 domain-containing protein [Virgibacillus salinus]|uniref:Uncharacterized conserved protein, DUF58 family, contains vWF domain n=1 Tax=Virgibacillus salinus TaxID=553311 RepID=A0A1H1GGY2_9BACI|nr:DUF58 domain-containing protein [Virgibacillus salinus]SDR12148.1 Uncharacterized conserved protein, DUF58 family, contains vWF domain [Virgibacillus salinus]
MTGTIRFIGKLSFVVFLLLLLFSFAMFQGGFVSWFLFFGFLPIFLYHLGLLFYPIKRWHVTRSLSHHVIRAGGRIAVTVKIKRTIPYPLYYCICEEIFPDTLQKVDNQNEKYRNMDKPNKLQVSRKIKKIVFPGFSREIELPYYIEQVPRGEHQLQALRIRTGDVLGFVKKEHIFYLSDQIVAFPNERPVHIAESITSYEQGSISAYAMNLKNSNVATGIREYTPGDKFSWIDWKQTAKKNTIITKEFEQEKSTDTMVILDSCYNRGINDLAFEAGIELTMSLVESIRKQASQVGFLSIGENVVYFPMHHDPSKKDLIRQHLTRLQPGGTRSFSMVLREETTKISSGANMILVTTQMDDMFRESIQKVKQRSKRVIILFIQSSALISRSEHNIIQQLRFEGVVINVLTEKQLVQKIIEVNVS